MPDYHEMYLTMVRASEKALRTLASAQKHCEELYLREEAADAAKKEESEEH